MCNKKVMICDDNIAVHESLSQFLASENIDVISVYDGVKAVDSIRSTPVDLVILDIMLPTISGIDVCREIRTFSDVPIIFLSAKSEEIDRIVGLELGADDYVTKPFSPREVVIRVKKILSRNCSNELRNILKYHELEVNEESMKVFVSGDEIEMTAKEISLIAYFIKNANKVLNREQLLSAVWGFNYYGESRAVDAIIKRVRKKLPSENVSFEIQSIYGVGYRLGEK